ncbi:YceD family protein [Defluviimonas salinarum]|uniref:DUF177 domain-containing protein n=1 Tax=Defluviimonas salinarum TaxID=2992147 RepID=A0ABT3IX31_9RHOB|nr:DUF177 domain-containing protein [Defluviimonas salinarum]MCW3779987.1 DUF177 domain-containing protein [Defluviimonas salinarum]
MSSHPTVAPHPLRVADLAARKPTRFDLKPESEMLERIAAEIGVVAVAKLRFRGELLPQGRRDWLLRAELGATVTQACVVSLAPVVTRIEETVERRYLADMPEPDGEEIEMPEDETAEPLPTVIDAGAVMVEALTLALPLYPRAEGAEVGTTSVTPPGAEPLADEERRPFAGLADLMKKNGGGE